MTGYGKESISFEGKTIQIEVKSLNSKSLDLYTKIPSIYREKELMIRQVISEKLNRGKIDLMITIENSGTQKNIEINKDLVKNYYLELKALDEIIGEKANDPIAMYLNDIATIPTNLAGIGGMSVPSGLAQEDGLPAGFQIMAPAMKDDRMYQVGAALEAALLTKWGKPILASAPVLGAK